MDKGHCSNCSFWRKQKDNDYSKSMGICDFLSGNAVGEVDEYPDTEKTGIESYPISIHDGHGFFYETKDWFGCVNYKE